MWRKARRKHVLWEHQLRREGRRLKAPTTLPHDIIESILSCLPVKYLIRFKVVSKLWEATISDPRFAEKHLQRYKNSSSRNLLTLPLFGGREGLDVVELQNDYFRSVSRIEHSREDSSGYVTLCRCDGLFLQHCRVLDEIETYVLWNPSCRAYKEIFCPQEIDDSNCSTIYGIYICLVNTYKNEARIMKKLEGDGKDSWMEIKLQYCRTPLLYPVPMCWVSEDEIILRFNKLSRYVLYDLPKNTFLSLHNCRYFEYDYMVPYLENLFLQ